MCIRDSAGTITDIGGFSFNYHKHIHTGEGGVCVTNDSDLSERLCLIRNHAEVVCDQKAQENIVNMIGFNFRLAEPLCLMALEQMKIHMAGIKAELGIRGPEQGHYPRVVYEQPAYKNRGITGNCPIAESVAKMIEEGTYISNG